MTVASEIDEEEQRRRDAPMGDISPSTVAAGMRDDEPPTPKTMDLPELDLSAQGDDSQAPDVAPQGSSPSDWAAYSPTPEVKPDTSRADFARQLAGIVGQRYQPRAELSDEAIGRARDKRKQGGKWGDLSRAITAWAFRKPFEPTPPEDTATELTQQRTKEEASFEKDRSMQLALAKALKGGKPAEMTPYQRAELDMRGRELGAKRDEKANALEARKRTMLSLYPERKADIEALTDLGDAQALQTALEGRMGRESTQTHSDEAADRARRERETEARAASDRELRKQIAFEQWKQQHQNLTAEQKTQLEGIEKSDEVLDTFEGGLGAVSGVGGKIAAKVPGVSGAIGASGAEFPATREGTAIGLARGLEGGTARPGNVEIIQHMLPEASDADNVKAAKMRTIRAFVKNNREAFMRAAEQGGTHLQPTSPHVSPQATYGSPPGVQTRKMKNGGTAYRGVKTGRWFTTEDEARAN